MLRRVLASVVVVVGVLMMINYNKTRQLQDGLQDGLAAYERGDYETAHELWLPLAELGNAVAQNDLGLMIEGGPLTIHAKDIAGGMSGSPILADNGSAIGVVCCSSVQAKKEHRQDGSNPRLSIHLPGWLLRALL